MVGLSGLMIDGGGPEKMDGTRGEREEAAGCSSCVYFGLGCLLDWHYGADFVALGAEEASLSRVPCSLFSCFGGGLKQQLACMHEPACKYLVMR